jgi:hypothetical protein
MAVASHRLNLLAATFFPIATISAIFSMHLSHGLDISDRPYFFRACSASGWSADFCCRKSSSPASTPRPKQPASQKAKRAAVRKGR